MPVDRATFEQVRKRVIETAPAGLSREQFDQLLDSELAKLEQQQPVAPATQAPPSRLARAASTVADVGIGAAKGAVNTVSGLGDLARLIPGVSALDRIMEPIQVDVTPKNAAQHVGFSGEQIGEFFMPVVGSGGKVAQAVKSAGLTMAQTGSPTAAGVSGAVTAVMPGGRAVRRAADLLSESAEKSMAQALGPTKEVMKTEAAKLAPQMLARGVRGTRSAMLDQAREKVAQVGAAIGDEYRAAAAAGKTIDGIELSGTLALAKDAFVVETKHGARTPIPGTERIIKRLNNLIEFVDDLGPEIPADKAAKITTMWQRIVSKSGLYGPKAGASATDQANAWAFREAAESFRTLLNRASPTLDELNAEYAFWKSLRNVLKETERRTQPQGGGLSTTITAATGAGAGFASGDSMTDRVQNAVIGGMLGRQALTLLQSPWWRTSAAGPFKQALADALASGSAPNIVGAISKATRAMPGQVAQAVGP